MKISLIPALKDNYIFILQSKDSTSVTVVDPGDAHAVEDYCRQNELVVGNILLTHHHADHVAGTNRLQSIFGARVTSPKEVAGKVAQIDHLVDESIQFNLHEENVRVLSLPGHTADPVAYFFEESKLLFSGDTLFGCGCGKLFEGTPQQMFASLAKIKSLPANTKVYCAHEYTQRNLDFVLDLKSKKIVSHDLKPYATWLESLLELGLPSVPLSLDLEKTCNPFLTARTAEEFAYLRSMRDLW